jgi:glycosyltransferase involved in cell wall biosynthesis
MDAAERLWPRITVVTPSYNQGRYIAETIESVAGQGYPNLEHIVIDGGSRDGTLDVLTRYPHLRVVSEPDRGQADAINKGFAIAGGDIWCFLNSDDTLLPGALERVAREIDPARGRHVVMGRCRFIGGDGRDTGIEHPSAFESYWRVLAVWKGYTIPQPAVFWTPEVWRTCGPMDLALKYHLDYDLFCRVARRYRFHVIDQVLATYRLHAESKTEGWTEADRLGDSIALSRRYWGLPITPFYWTLALSLAAYRLDRVGRARRLYLAAREVRRQGRRMHSWPLVAAATALAPEVAFYLGVYPTMRSAASRTIRRAAARLARRRPSSVQTRVYLEKDDPWDDRWVGPQVAVIRRVTEGAQRVIVSGSADLTYLSGPLSLTLSVDGRAAGTRDIVADGPFVLVFDLEQPLPRGDHHLEVRASDYFVPHQFTRGRDFRPLSWRVAPIDPFVVVSAGAMAYPVDHGPGRPRGSTLWFAEGWHQLEATRLDWHRWAPDRGTLHVEVPTRRAALLRGEILACCRPNVASVAVNGRVVATLNVAGERFAPFAVAIELEAMDNRIEFQSGLPAVRPSGDRRLLGIAIRNLVLEAAQGAQA